MIEDISHPNNIFSPKYFFLKYCLHLHKNNQNVTIEILDRKVSNDMQILKKINHTKERKTYK